MKRFKYGVQISSPISHVYDTMLGLSDISTYGAWTSPFNPTSTYEGNWAKGSKMLFVGTNEKGEKAGMVSRILENKINEFVSIQHYGVLEAGKEITEGPHVESWAGGLENYHFEEHDAGTQVTVEIDASSESEEYMNKLYPTALEKLKEICERG